MQEAWNKNCLNDVCQVPTNLAQVTFGKVTLESVGQVLTPTQVKNQPQVSWVAEKDTLYTVVMTDPDAPSRKDPTYREWFHWGVCNIPGTDLSKGEVFAEFVSSAPPPNSGLHRYVILVYKQKAKISYEDPLSYSMNGRPKYNVRKMAEKYELGDPVAGACYQAEYDDYVPEVYKRLGAA